MSGNSQGKNPQNKQCLTFLPGRAILKKLKKIKILGKKDTAYQEHDFFTFFVLLKFGMGVPC